MSDQHRDAIKHNLENIATMARDTQSITDFLAPPDEGTARAQYEKMVEKYVALEARVEGLIMRAQNMEDECNKKFQNQIEALRRTVEKRASKIVLQARKILAIESELKDARELLQLKRESEESLKTRARELSAQVDELRQQVSKLQAKRRYPDKVMVLAYQYRGSLQMQVQGVFTSYKQVNEWLKENPPATGEEYKLYNYTLNRGEL